MARSNLFDVVDYDSDTRRLAVGFRREDATWVYYGVPPTVAAAFVDADSLGAFFNRNIRGKYPSEGPLY